MSIRPHSHRVAWAYSGALATGAFTAGLAGALVDQPDHIHALLIAARMACGITAAAFLCYGWVLKRLGPDERVLVALLEEKERSGIDADRGVTDGDVVSLNRKPAPRSLLSYGSRGRPNHRLARHRVTR